MHRHPWTFGLLILLGPACLPGPPNEQGQSCSIEHPCGDGYVCVQSQCQQNAASSGNSHKRLFLSSGTFTGRLGGFAGADALCQGAAQAAGLGTSWIAWVSTDAVNAIDRITVEGSWSSVDGSTLYFASRQGFASTPTTAAFLDQSGKPNSANCIWTGTSLGGVKASATCLNWSSDNSEGIFGTPNDSPTTWTDATRGNYLLNCHATCSILCIEL